MFDEGVPDTAAPPIVAASVNIAAPENISSAGIGAVRAAAGADAGASGAASAGISEASVISASVLEGGGVAGLPSGDVSLDEDYIKGMKEFSSSIRRLQKVSFLPPLCLPSSSSGELLFCSVGYEPFPTALACCCLLSFRSTRRSWINRKLCLR